MKAKRIILAIISASILCLVSQTGVSAANNSKDAAVLYEMAGITSSELKISGSTASCKSHSVSGTAVSITAEQILQKQGYFWLWYDVENANWKKTASANSIVLSNSKGGLQKGTYRVKTILTLTDSSGKTETITVCSIEKAIE